jgi:hypothetical protein
LDYSSNIIRAMNSRNMKKTGENGNGYKPSIGKYKY